MTATPYWEHPAVTLFAGDCREVLRELPAESVQTVVTSPPYWSLRDYGIAPSVWEVREPGDGTEWWDHEHEWGATVEQQRGGLQTEKSRWQHIENGRGEFQERIADELGRDEDGRRVAGLVDGHPAVASGQFCGRCGAWRGCLGLEPTPELFVAHMVEVFREVRRVLRRDGTLWLNIGDSYASGGGRGEQGKTEAMAGRAVLEARNGRGGRLASPKHADPAASAYCGPNRYAQAGLKPKDLVGIPWMVAFALRADGWWLRQDIVWHKPNPMPESVTDRCTKAHEYVLLLSKSERYYYDADAIREPSPLQADPTEYAKALEQTSEQWYQRVTSPFEDGKKSDKRLSLAHPDGRNKRSVWTIPTAPFGEAHFATFPPALVEPCVLAGTSEAGCCAECGAPRERLTETDGIERRVVGKRAAKAAVGLRTQFSGAAPGTPTSPRVTTIGWRATCSHDAPSVPCVVLDPFAGSGTTAMVARDLGRRAIGIDASAEYLAMAVRRIGGDVALPLGNRI